jgi:hypothetical protein
MSLRVVKGKLKNDESTTRKGIGSVYVGRLVERIENRKERNIDTYKTVHTCARERARK